MSSLNTIYNFRNQSSWTPGIVNNDSFDKYFQDSTSSWINYKFQNDQFMLANSAQISNVKSLININNQYAIPYHEWEFFTSSNLTISGWFKLDSLQNNDIIFQIGSSNAFYNTADNIVAWYKFDNNATDMLLDSSGKGNHLINNNFVSFSNIDFKTGTGSVYFNGTAQWFDMHQSINPFSIQNNDFINIFITNSGTPLTNYKIKIALDYHIYFRTDFQDIRVYDTNGNALNYFIENVITGISADLWVLIPYIASEMKLTLTYSNTNSTGNVDSVGSLTTTALSYTINKTLRKYPPVDITLPTTNALTSLFIISNQVYGNGTYIISASSSSSLSTSCFNVFVAGSVNYWTTTSSLYNTSTFVYTGIQKTTTYNISSSPYSTVHSGEWVQIELPSAIILTSYLLVSSTFNTSTSGINDFVILGSNDGSNWGLLDSKTAQNLNTSSVHSVYNLFTNTTPYRFYRLVVTKIVGNAGYLSLGDWRLFGREITSTDLSAKGISFSFWMKMNISSGSYSRIIDLSDYISGSAPTNWVIIGRNAATNTIYFELGIASSTTNQVSITNIVDNNWHYIVWSISYIGAWSIFVDNVNMNTTRILRIPNITWTKRYIGKSSFTANGNLVGNIDNLRIYDRVLTASEISVLYHNNNIILKKNDNKISFQINYMPVHEQLIDKSEGLYANTWNSIVWNINNSSTNTGYVKLNSIVKKTFNCFRRYELKFPPLALSTTASTDNTKTKELSNAPYYNGTYLIDWSSELSDANPWRPSQFFNADTTGSTTGQFATSTYDTTTGGYTFTPPRFISSDYYGEWVKLTLPNAIYLAYVKFYQRTDLPLRAPKDFRVYGSNDGNTWTILIDTISAIYTSYVNTSYATNLLFAYRFFAITFNKIFEGNDGVCNFNEIEFYGYPIDYNDYRYPPSALTSSYTNLTSCVYGNGLYITSASTITSASEADWEAFNHNNNTATDIWTPTSTYNGTNNAYAGQTSSLISGIVYKGDWLQIQLPESIVLSSYFIYTKSDALTRGPKDFYIAASNDGITWILIDSRTSVTGYTTTGKQFLIHPSTVQQFSSLNGFTYYRIVITSAGSNTLSISEWELYGFPVFNVKLGQNTNYSETCIRDFKVFTNQLTYMNDNELQNRQLVPVNNRLLTNETVVTNTSNDLPLSIKKWDEYDDLTMSFKFKTNDLQNNEKFLDFSLNYEPYTEPYVKPNQIVTQTFVHPIFIVNGINQTPTLISGNDYYYAFTSTSATNNIRFTQNLECEVLIIGGGGGGGFDAGGGGGGGQVLYYTNRNVAWKSGGSVKFTEGLYTVNIGVGGTKATTAGSVAGNGGTSTIINANTSATVLGAEGGGGAGSKQANGATTLGGGGGGGQSGSGITIYKLGGPSSGTGGNGGNSSDVTGGGGGGGANKGHGADGSGNGGNGGNGVNIDIIGSIVGYGGGGGGGVLLSQTPSSASFGGGAGGNTSLNGVNGTDNTGGGGGGGGSSGRSAGDGGTGIIIFRYTASVIQASENTYYLSFTDTTRPYTLITPQDIVCDVLVVGGGGAGGTRSGGGGGAGACLYLINQTLKQGIYNIVVGAGSTIANTNGYDSYIQDMQKGYIDIYRAKGGGGGGITGATDALQTGKAGGSSGGSRGGTNILSYDILSSNNLPVGRYGNRGGSGSIASPGNANTYGGGGGGGAGSVGGNSSTSGNAVAGNGGTGLLINITGIDVYYAGGGGGGCASTGTSAGTGGSSIGGNGSKGDVAAGHGIPNTGSGGGGSGFLASSSTANGTHGNGGSGIIIIRYTIPNDKNIRIMRKNNDISFEINNTSIYLLPYKNGVWNTITWNISRSGSTNSFVRVNNENPKYYTKIPLSSGIYSNKLETSYNKIIDFKVDTSPLTISSYITDSFNHVYYKFASSTDLLTDASIYNRTLINNGGTYINDMSKDALLLMKTTYTSIPSENWSTCNNLTISTWMKTTSMSNLDKIINFDAPVTQNFGPNQYKIKLLNTVITDQYLLDYQVKVSIPYYSDFRTDFQDIRILNTDNTVLNHYIEKVIPGVSADVWVKVPVYTNNLILTVTYGNALSIGDASTVFDLYDTFNTLDTNKWRLSTDWDSTNNQPIVIDGYLKLTRDYYITTIDENENTINTLVRAPNTVLCGIDSISTFSLSNYIIELKTCANASNVTDYPSANIIFRADISNNYGIGIQYNTTGSGTNGMGVVFNNPYSNINTTTLSFPSPGQAFPKFNTLLPTSTDWQNITVELLDNTISLSYNNTLIHKYNFGSTYQYNGPGRVGIYSKDAGNIFIDELKIYKTTSNITSNIFYKVPNTLTYNNIQITSDAGMMSFLINNTPVYKTYIKDNMWNHVLWNVTSNNSTKGFIRINNGTKYEFNEIPLVSNNYINTIGSIANVSNLYLADFRIYTGDLSTDIEDSLFKYSLKNNKHLHYTFKSPQLLSDDDSGNNRHFINNGGAIYERQNNINSLLLKETSNILLPNDDWSIYDSVTISGMFKMSSISAMSNILYEFSFPYNYDRDIDSISSNLIARYNFENNFNDVSGNNYHLTTTSSPTFDTNNKIQGSYSAYFTVNNFLTNTNVSVSNRSFTISFWMKPYNFNSTVEYWVFTQGTVQTTRQLLIFLILTNNKFRFAFYNDDLDSPVYNLNQLNQWFHVTLTYNKENNREMKIYKDGILCASKNAGGDTLFDNTFRIGKTAANINNHYYGNIDDFRIYNTALSADVIYKIYKYSETKYANIKLVQNYDRLTFNINDKPIYKYLINNNIWYNITWNINKLSTRSFIRINENRFVYDAPVLMSGSYTNILGSTSNLGNFNVSDFKIFTVPITKEIEDELNNLSAYEYMNYIDYNGTQIHSNQIIIKNYNYDLTDIYAHYKFENQQSLCIDNSRNLKNLNNFGGIYAYDYSRNSILLRNSEIMTTSNENWYNYENLSLSFWYKTNNFKYGDKILDFRPNTMSQFTMKYPRQPITNYTQIYTDGSGIQVRVAESSRASTTDNYSYRLFNQSLYTDNNGWASLDKYNTSGSGMALNTMSYFNNHRSFYGEWVMIDLKELIYLEKYRIYPLNDSTQRSPQDFRIYATNDDASWSYPQSGKWFVIDEELNVTGYENNNFKEFYVPGVSQAYRYFAIIINRNQGGTNSQYVQFTEWELFGRSAIEHPIYVSTSNITPIQIGDTDNYYLSFVNTTYPHYISFNQNMNCDVLLVGGGGGGGVRHGGGGGGGGFVYVQNVNFSANTTYTINVGIGGTAGNSITCIGNNGGFSRIVGKNIDIIAYGGGGGGGSHFAAARLGDAISDPIGVNGFTNSTNYLDNFGNLGSGGGSGGDASNGTTLYTYGNVIRLGNGGNIPGYSFGNSGGTGKTYFNGSWIGAGGGGANTVGESNSTSSSPADIIAGNGGNGRSCDITGSNIFYAGGGGGGANVGLTAGTGGTGGGGAGSVSTNTAVNGTPNTGGGGGGSGYNADSNGAAGNGGSGIVIIRYMLPRNTVTRIKPNITITNTPTGMHFNVNKNTVFIDNNYTDNTWIHVLWNIKNKNNKGFLRINNGYKYEYTLADKTTITSLFPREPLTNNTLNYYDTITNSYIKYTFNDDPIAQTTLTNTGTGINMNGTISNASVSQFILSYPIFNNHDANLVAWYKFDNSDLTIDSSGKNNVLSIYSTPTFSTSSSIRGTGYISFSSSSVQYAQIPTSTIKTNGITKDQLSFCFWIKKNENPGGYRHYFTVDSGIDSDFAGSIYFGNSAGGSTYIHVRYGNVVVDINTDFNNTDTGSWKHYALVIKKVGTNANILFYVNGIEYTAYSSTPWIELANLVKLNKWQNGFYDVMSKDIDDFRIYDRALSATEIKQVYGYTITRSTNTPNSSLSYSYYWNGSLTNTADNAYITIPKTGIDPIISSTNFSVIYWGKYESLTNKFSILNMKKDADNTYIDIICDNTNLIFNTVDLNSIIDYPETATLSSANESGYTSGGYIVRIKGSSTLNSVSQGYWKMFNKVLTSATESSTAGWTSAADKYSSQVGNVTTNYFSNDSSYFGEYNMIDMGRSIILKSYVLYPPNASSLSRMPKDFKIYATNDDSGWTTQKDNTKWIQLDQRTVTNWTADTSQTFTLTNNNTPYRYYAILIRQLQDTNTDNYCEIVEWVLKGYPVYQSIFNNQITLNVWSHYAFTLGYSNSSITVTLYKNTILQSSSVFKNISSFGFTSDANAYARIGDNSTNTDPSPSYISDFNLYNKTLTSLEVSQIYSYNDSASIKVIVTASSGIDPYKLFNNIFYSSSNGWSSDSAKYNLGMATNTDSFFNSDSGYNGEWVMIDLAESMILQRYRIYPYNDSLKRTPKDFRIYATNDTDSWSNPKSGKWIILDEETNIIDYANNNYKEFAVYTKDRYRYYAILINKTQPDNDTTTVQFSELAFYGITEYNINDTVHSFINKIGYTMNQGSLYISDFMIITRPIDYEYENTLYNTLQNEAKILNTNSLLDNLMNLNSLYFNTSKKLETTNTGVIVYGNVTVTGTTVSTYSDMRLKEIVGNIDRPIDKLMKLNTYKYTANEIAESLGIHDNSIQVGLSAQEVQEVLPELVDLAPIDRVYQDDNKMISKSGENYLTLSYEGLVPVLIECIKTFRKKLASLSFSSK